jgi:hypothetical protein
LLLLVYVKWLAGESVGNAAVPRRPRVAVVTFYAPRPQALGGGGGGGGGGGKGHKWLEKMTAAVIENHKSYALRHGYDHIHLNTTLNADWPYWTKLMGLRDVLASHKHDWVLYLDSDAVVVHPDTLVMDWLAKHATGSTSALGVTVPSMSSTVPSTTGLIFSGDTLIINNGVMLLRGDARPASTRAAAAAAAAKRGGGGVSGAQWALQLFEDALAIGPARASVVPNYDQGVMAALLAGCTRSSSEDDLKACYARVDKGYAAAQAMGDRSIEVAIRSGNIDHVLLKDMIPRHVRPYVQLVPDTTFNINKCDAAELVCHVPNTHGKQRANKLQAALHLASRWERGGERERKRAVVTETANITSSM